MKLTLVIFKTFFFALLFCAQCFVEGDQSPEIKFGTTKLRGASTPEDDEKWAVQKFFTNGGKVEMVLFYGRRRYTKLQLPYLLQNKKTDLGLPNPGGPVVSTVHVILNTNVTEDIKYIHTVVNRDPTYFKLHQGYYGLNYCRFYSKFNETNTMYVKLDDDILYIAPDAVYNMVKMKLNSNFIFISGNIINHAAISKYHVIAGIFTLDMIDEAYVDEIKKGFTDVRMTPHAPYHFDGDAWGDHTWRSGPHAFLQHLMFLYFLRKGDLGIYHVGKKDLDSERYYRWSINFFLFEASDMKKFEVTKCGTNDELYLSMFLPHDVGKHSAVCGDAVVVHFAYTPQRTFLETNTSMLQRYHNLSLTMKGKSQDFRVRGK
eukprot:gene1353-2615_t